MAPELAKLRPQMSHAETASSALVAETSRCVRVFIISMSWLWVAAPGSVGIEAGMEADIEAGMEAGAEAGAAEAAEAADVAFEPFKSPKDSSESAPIAFAAETSPSPSMAITPKADPSIPRLAAAGP